MSTEESWCGWNLVRVPERDSVKFTNFVIQRQKLQIFLMQCCSPAAKGYNIAWMLSVCDNSYNSPSVQVFYRNCKLLMIEKDITVSKLQTGTSDYLSVLFFSIRHFNNWMYDSYVFHYCTNLIRATSNSTRLTGDSSRFTEVSFILNNRVVEESRTAGIFIRDTAYFHSDSMNCDFFYRSIAI